MIKINKEGKDIFVLSFGSLIAQAIPIVASLILAHIYNAEQYGNWGTFLSFAGILSVVVMGQYEMAIVRPELKDEKNADNLVRLCVLIGVGFSLLLYLVLILSDFFDLSYIKSIPCRYLLPLFVFFSGFLQVYLHYANRHEQYKFIAVSGIIRNGIQALSRIVLGVFNSLYGLIFGAFFGLFVSDFYGESKFSLRKILVKGYVWSDIKSIALRYRYFPFFLLPSTLLNSLSTNLPVLILISYFSKDYIGYFSMTISLLFLPVQLLSNAMSKVFYKKSSMKNNDEEVRALSFQLFKVAYILGFIMNLVIILFGEHLFAFFLGHDWKMSGTYAILLSPWILMTLCFSPLSVIFDSRDKQSTEFLFNVVLFVLRILLVFLGSAVINNMDLTVFMYGACGFVVWAVEGFVILKIIGLEFTFSQKIFLLLSILMIIVLWISKAMYILF